MDHSYVFNYFGKKLLELKDEYGFTLFDNNPCSIRNKGDIKLFVNRLSKDLFEENDYYFINEEEPNNRLEFTYRGQKLSFEIDSKFGHIELDFYRTVEFMGFLSGKMIAMVNPTAVYVVGEEDDMKEAWAKGLPIHIPEINFRHRNMTGKYFEKQEVGAIFIVDGVITLEEYEVELIIGLNDFLKERSYNIRYSSMQIKAYIDHRKYICALVNGDYCGGILVDNGKMTIKNGFENQIFLSRYLDKHPKSKVLYKGKGSSEEEIVLNFLDFVSKLGKEV
jgi:hypothetical protein